MGSSFKIDILFLPIVRSRSELLRIIFLHLLDCDIGVKLYVSYWSVLMANNANGGELGVGSPWEVCIAIILFPSGVFYKCYLIMLTLL